MGFGGGLPGFWPAGMVGWGPRLRLRLRLTLRLRLRKIFLHLGIPGGSPGGGVCFGGGLPGLHLGLGFRPSSKICCDIHSPWQPRWWWWVLGVGCQVFGQLGWQEGGA